MLSATFLFYMDEFLHELKKQTKLMKDHSQTP